MWSLAPQAMKQLQRLVANLLLAAPEGRYTAAQCMGTAIFKDAPTTHTVEKQQELFEKVRVRPRSEAQLQGLCMLTCKARLVRKLLMGHEAQASQSCSLCHTCCLLSPSPRDLLQLCGSF
jgi:hypothetical protein